jgi:ribosomal-protein-alanine N-acetyltransferase
MRTCGAGAASSLESRASLAPWTEHSFCESIAAGHDCWVLPGKPLRGFLIVSIAADESHLLNPAALPEYQGQGLGSRLAQFAMERARDNGACRRYLEVRPSNRVARRMYTADQFKLLGRRKSHYSGSAEEDALIRSRALGQNPTPAEVAIKVLDCAP